MNFRAAFRGLIPLRWQRPRKDEPASLVLLLRQRYFFRADELCLAAQRAWRTPFTTEEKSSKHFVVQTGHVTLLKAGPHLLNFFHHPKPYFDNPKEYLEWRPHLSQQQAWAQHSAYGAVDYLNHRVDVELAYCVLAKLVAEMLDGNCTGLYLARESSVIPNDESLYLQLQKIASSREPGITVKPTPLSP